MLFGPYIDHGGYMPAMYLSPDLGLVFTVY